MNASDDGKLTPQEARDMGLPTPADINFGLRYGRGDADRRTPQQVHDDVEAVRRRRADPANNHKLMEEDRRIFDAARETRGANAHPTRQQWLQRYQQWRRGEFGVTVEDLVHAAATTFREQEIKQGKENKEEAAADRRPLRPSGYCSICAKKVSVNIHGTATTHFSEGLTTQGICPGSERGLDSAPVRTSLRIARLRKIHNKEGFPEDPFPAGVDQPSLADIAVDAMGPIPTRDEAQRKFDEALVRRQHGTHIQRVAKDLLPADIGSVIEVSGLLVGTLMSYHIRTSEIDIWLAGDHMHTLRRADKITIHTKGI